MLRPDIVMFDLIPIQSRSNLDPIQRETECQWLVAGVPESTRGYWLAGGVSVATTRSNGYTTKSGQTSIVVVSPSRVLKNWKSRIVSIVTR